MMLSLLCKIILCNVIGPGDPTGRPYIWVGGKFRELLSFIPAYRLVA